MPFLTTPISSAAIPVLARAGCALLCAFWLLAGNLGHDPWKADDAIHLNIAYGMTHGDWLIPRLAGEVWITSPPLFHWLAALCGKLFTGFLSWHEAARLATALCGAVLLSSLSLTARRLTGTSSGLAAPFLAIGTLGLLVPLHDTHPIAASLAGWTISLLGLAQWRTHPLPGGILLGTGIGLGFLAGGVLAGGLSLITGVLLLIHPQWRHSPLPWATALLLALLIIFPWPWLLYQQAPDLFKSWWNLELTRRPLTHGFSRDHFELLTWAAWPVLPLALWNVWLERRRLWESCNFLPLVATSVALVAFFFSAPTDINLLPALMPLTLLAANGAGRLRRGAANAFDWFGMMTFTLLAALIWLGGIAILTGEPQRVAKNFTIPAPDFVAQLSVGLITLAIAASVGWIAIMLRTPRSPWRPAARWSIGFTTTWILLSTLWLPWIDHVKTYRQVSAGLHERLSSAPKKLRHLSDCIARDGLGAAHRASLDYFNGIRTVPLSQEQNCRHLIVQTDPKTDKDIPGWKLILEASRPADKSERLRLYRRN